MLFYYGMQVNYVIMAFEEQALLQAPHLHNGQGAHFLQHGDIRCELNVYAQELYLQTRLQRNGEAL
jgi:hypothetical protein